MDNYEKPRRYLFEVAIKRTSTYFTSICVEAENSNDALKYLASTDDWKEDNLMDDEHLGGYTQHYEPIGVMPIVFAEKGASLTETLTKRSADENTRHAKVIDSTSHLFLDNLRDIWNHNQTT